MYRSEIFSVIKKMLRPRKFVSSRKKDAHTHAAITRKHPMMLHVAG